MNKKTNNISFQCTQDKNSQEIEFEIIIVGASVIFDDVQNFIRQKYGESLVLVKKKIIK